MSAADSFIFLGFIRICQRTSPFYRMKGTVSVRQGVNVFNDLGFSHHMKYQSTVHHHANMSSTEACENALHTVISFCVKTESLSLLMSPVNLPRLWMKLTINDSI